MTAAAIVCFAAAAAIWTAPLAAVAALFTWDWFACRGEREANELETTPEWLALLAATEVDEDADLIFQQMCFQKWEAEL